MFFNVQKGWVMSLTFGSFSSLIPGRLVQTINFNHQIPVRDALFFNVIDQ